jgi:hypothetical protein
LTQSFYFAIIKARKRGPIIGPFKIFKKEVKNNDQIIKQRSVEA